MFFTFGNGRTLPGLPGGGRTFCGCGRHRACKRRPATLRITGVSDRVRPCMTAPCFQGKPPAGAARGGDGEHGNEQGACDCEPGAANAAGLGRGRSTRRPQADLPTGGWPEPRTAAKEGRGFSLTVPRCRNAGAGFWPGSSQAFRAEGASLVRRHVSDAEQRGRQT